MMLTNVRYFIPIAIFYGHPDIGVGLYIWKSMIPAGQ